MPSAIDGLRAGIERTSEEATVTFRSVALSYGWPKEVVNELSIVNEDGSFRLKVPDHLRDTVDTLEHGNQNHPPRPASGNYFHSQDHQARLNRIFMRNMKVVNKELSRLLK